MYSDAGALPAMILVFADEGFKASAYCAEHVLRKKDDKSDQSTTAFSLAHSGLSFWEYFAKEGNEDLRTRFASAMRSWSQFRSSEGETILQGESRKHTYYTNRELTMSFSQVSLGVPYREVAQSLTSQEGRVMSPSPSLKPFLISNSSCKIVKK